MIHSNISMGGHGALICALKNPGQYKVSCHLFLKYKSVSAFAPISNPIDCPWGQKAFTGYLGSDKEEWKVCLKKTHPEIRRNSFDRSIQRSRIKHLDRSGILILKKLKGSGN